MYYFNAALFSKKLLLSFAVSHILLAMRPLKHLSPRYIYNRLWVMLDERLHPQNPWLTQDAVRLLHEMLTPHDKGIEFGAGRSTKWFAQRLQHLTSIESHPGWFEKVQTDTQDLASAGRLTLHLCTDEDSCRQQIAALPANSMDFCLIDGAWRDSCALGMLDKMKVGGLFVIDNVNRYLPRDDTYAPATRRTADGPLNATWAQVMAALANWRLIYTSNGVTDTAIWIKTDYANN